MSHVVTTDHVEKTIAAFTRLDQKGDKKAMNKLAQRLQKEQPFLLQHAAAVRTEHGDAVGEAAVFYATLVWAMFDRGDEGTLPRLTAENLNDADQIVTSALGKIEGLVDKEPQERVSPELVATQPHIYAKLAELLAEDVKEAAMTAETASTIIKPTEVVIEASVETAMRYLPRVLGRTDLMVVRLVHREQGLIVAAGNPLEITGIADLSRPEVRYVNRQRGAGTRVLLDHELRRHGMAPADVTGYQREEHTHLAVAAAVAAGRADAGLGIRPAIRPFELDFVPVALEPYDLVLTQQTYDSPLLAPLWNLLADDNFRASIDALGGYSTAETGRRIR